MRSDRSTTRLLAEALSAIAVVVSLVFVGLEVRESARQTALNTQSLQVSAYQDLVAQINEVNRLGMEDPGIPGITGVSSWEDLSSTQTNQLTSRLFYALRLGDLAFYQYELGMLTEERLESALGWLTTLVCSPLFEEFWAEVSWNFVPNYRDYIESKISTPENCPTALLSPA